jgi:archaemetzincin
VFGEAECPGKTAVISVHRLKPEFYERKPDEDLLLERTTKEAVHELGHTFGLQHCPNPFCVMYFSNSIFETDRKQSLFCNKCTTNLSNITSLQRRRTD